MRFSAVTLAAVSAFVMAACGAATTPTFVIAPTASPVATPSSASPNTVTTPPSYAPTPTAPPPTLAPTQAPSATAAAVVDLCALLSAADLESVLGGSWMEGRLGVTGGYCFWLDSSDVSYDQVTTAIDARSLEQVKLDFGATPKGVDMNVSGRAGYLFIDENSTYRTMYVYVDLGGRLLTLEITSSSAPGDQISAQELAEIAIGNI